MSKRTIRIGSLTIPEPDKAEIRKILDSNQISPGPYVKNFENDFARYHGANSGLFVNSGTDALRIALATLKEVGGWNDGDYVIVPALTFVATVNVILQNKLRPLFVDVSPMDYNINASLIERAIQGKPVQAIMPVHLFGSPCNMAMVKNIADEYCWRVIEDSCESMGVSKIAGDIACYSTYVAHLIATGVGGLAITNNPIYSDVMRSFANHGRNTFYIPGFTQPALTKDLLKKRFRFERIGYSSRVSEFEAALGICQLNRLSKNIKRRQQIAEALMDGIGRFPDFDLYNPMRTSAWMMFPIVIHQDSSIDKWDLCLFLEKNGIETREMLPLIDQPCYVDLEIDPEDYPVANHVNEKGFYIGCHPEMTDEDIRYVLDVFEEFFYQQLTKS